MTQAPLSVGQVRKNGVASLTVLNGDPRKSRFDDQLVGHLNQWIDAFTSTRGNVAVFLDVTVVHTD